MQINRRDIIRGAAAVAATGSLTLFVGAGSAPAATHKSLAVGSRGAAVTDLQRRLARLGYWFGRLDGQYGDLTRQAVVAIQKVGGLERDGECGPLTWAGIDAGLRPKPRSTKGHVVEINKTTQTLFIVDAGVVKTIYNASTGSNKRYLQEKKWYVALTPSGSFRVFRRVDKWDTGPLGKLYRPQYFNRGIAVHGYASVPSTPASHGCCRVSLDAMNSLWRAGGMEVGTQVLVY